MYITSSQTILGVYNRLYSIPLPFRIHIAPSHKGDCIEDGAGARPHFTDLKDAITDLKATVSYEMREMRCEIRQLGQESTMLRRLVTKAINGTRAEGLTLAYEDVPFVNGTMPPKALHKLTSLASISTLFSAHADIYLEGHGIEPASYSTTLPGKRQQVAEAIGVASDALRHRFGNYNA